MMSLKAASGCLLVTGEAGDVVGPFVVPVLESQSFEMRILEKS